MMVILGSSISFIEESVVASFSTKASTTQLSLKLVSVASDNIPILGCTLCPYSWKLYKESLLGDNLLFD